MLCNLIPQTESDECTWIRVGFCGVPYRIAKELIDNIVQYLECGDMTDLKEQSFEEHMEELHHGEVNIGNLLLVPAPVHIEKNFLLTVWLTVNLRRIFLCSMLLTN